MDNSVRLVFESKTEKDKFMGQLSDGWGENVCSLEWQGEFSEAEIFLVENMGNEKDDL